MRVFQRNSTVRAALPVALMLLAWLAGGCRALSGPGEPTLAARPYTEEEWMWTRSMKEMYPDWQEPARPPPPRRLSAGEASVAVAPPVAQPARPRPPAVAPVPAPAPATRPAPAQAPPASVASSQPTRTPPPAVGRSQAMSEALLAWQPVTGSATVPPALEPPRPAAPMAQPPPAVVPAPAPAPNTLPAPVVDTPATGRPLPPAEREAFQVVPESSVAAPAEGGRQAQYTVRKGDTLSAIAKRFYGSEAGVKAIVEANRDRLPNPDQLPAGTTLRLP